MLYSLKLGQMMLRVMKAVYERARFRYGWKKQIKSSLVVDRSRNTASCLVSRRALVSQRR